MSCFTCWFWRCSAKVTFESSIEVKIILILVTFFSIVLRSASITSTIWEGNHQELLQKRELYFTIKSISYGKWWIFVWILYHVNILPFHRGLLSPSYRLLLTYTMKQHRSFFILAGSLSFVFPYPANVPCLQSKLHMAQFWIEICNKLDCSSHRDSAQSDQNLVKVFDLQRKRNVQKLKEKIDK